MRVRTLSSTYVLTAHFFSLIRSGNDIGKPGMFGQVVVIIDVVIVVVIVVVVVAA